MNIEFDIISRFLSKEIKLKVSLIVYFYCQNLHRSYVAAVAFKRQYNKLNFSIDL